MKIKKLLINLTLYSILVSKAYSQEVEFKASKMDIKNDGKIIFAYNAKTLIPEKKIEITSKNAKYDKEKNILVFTNDVTLNDKENNLIIMGEQIKYEKNKDIFYSIGKTEFYIEKKYKVISKNVFFDRGTQIIYGKENTKITDNKKNIFNLKNNFKFNIKSEILKSKNSVILDKNKNKYIFEDLFVNLKISEIVGKEIKVEFNKSYFGNENNDPILKGKSSYSSEEELKVYKAAFSTCNVINKNCRGWELNTDEFKHDKKKKIFEYKNSWLKLFDHKLLFIPYFNHPDPTVKRKSGFLAPSYNSSDSLGTSVKFPYFKILGIDKDITLSPRYYANKSFLLQNEYRQVLQNSRILSDVSFLIGDAGTKGHLFYKQSGKLNNITDFNVNLQNVKGDNYLKTHKLIETSSLITSDSVLLSNLDLDWNLENADLSTSFKIYEDLSRNYHDRYQYIFPDFNFSKNIMIPENYNGKFYFNTYGYNKHYNTNIAETILISDFLFSSNDFVNEKGISTNFDILLKNANDYNKNPSSRNNNLNYNLFGILKIDTSYPLQKITKNYTNYLKPLVSLRYSPNGNSDLSSNDFMLNYNNVFYLDRIQSNSQVEGGESVSLGLEFDKNNNIGENILNFNIANVLKLDEDHNMPSKSKLNKKRSDVFGNLNFNFNENMTIGYSFSLDKDLKYSNQDQLNLNVGVNNFSNNISYFSEHNDLPDLETVKNVTQYSFDRENKLSFKLSKDLTNDYTQYYNFIYSHETDCISLNLNYNKSFYRDGSLEPSKSLSFLIKIIPFTEIGVPNLGSLVGN